MNNKISRNIRFSIGFSEKKTTKLNEYILIRGIYIEQQTKICFILAGYWLEIRNLKIFHTLQLIQPHIRIRSLPCGPIYLSGSIAQGMG